MNSYIKSFFSLKKLTHKNLSFLSVWDDKSSFNKDAEIKNFVKLKEVNIGRYSRINQNCQIANTKIGNFTAIGRNSTIGLGRHPMNFVSTQNIFYKKNNLKNDWVKAIDYDQSLPIEIGNDVWIGVETLIVDGVKIGDGAVIGARTVVTKDVPPYAVVVGTPGKIIKYRFDDEIINRLLKIKWWDLSDEEIDKKVEFFREPKITLDVLNKYFPVNDE